MAKLLGKPGALEPDKIEQMPKGYYLGIDTGLSESYTVWSHPSGWPWDIWNPSPLMRRLGYTRNPATCGHEKKRLMLGSTQWRCADCGTEL